LLKIRHNERIEYRLLSLIRSAHNSTSICITQSTLSLFNLLAALHLLSLLLSPPSSVAARRIATAYFANVVRNSIFSTSSVSCALFGGHIDLGRSADTPATAFIASRLDYCNVVLYKATMQVMRRLEMVMNSAARMVSGCGKYSIIPVLRDVLHWLPVPQRIQFKIAFLALLCTRGAGPAYFQLHISSTSAYRISLAEPVSVLLRNVEIWLCREQQRNSANVSALSLRSSGTVFKTICTRPPKDNFGVD